MVGTSTCSTAVVAASVASSCSNNNCSAPTNNSSGGGTSVSGNSGTGASGKKRAKRDPTTSAVDVGGAASNSASIVDSNSKMGVEATAVNHQLHHHNSHGHYFGAGNDYGSLKGKFSIDSVEQIERGLAILPHL